MKMTENLERRIIELVAADRIDIPISSMSGKLKRMKPKLADKVDILGYDNFYVGNRVYARVESEDKMKARGMNEGIELFEREFPRYGKIVRGMIEEQRAKKETHLYFGVNEGSKLTADDYMGVMTNLGFNESTARSLYPELMDISRKLSRKRQEERSILIG
jgi:hypothetical protein